MRVLRFTFTAFSFAALHCGCDKESTYSNTAPKAVPTAQSTDSQSLNTEPNRDDELLGKMLSESLDRASAEAQMKKLFTLDKNLIVKFANILVSKGIAQMRHEPFESFVDELLIQPDPLTLASQIVASGKVNNYSDLMQKVSADLYLRAKIRWPDIRTPDYRLLDDVINLDANPEIKGIFLLNIAQSFDSYGIDEVMKRVIASDVKIDDSYIADLFASWVTHDPEKVSGAVNSLPPGNFKGAASAGVAEYALACGQIEDAKAWAKEILDERLRASLNRLIEEHESGKFNHATFLKLDAKFSKPNND